MRSANVSNLINLSLRGTLCHMSTYKSRLDNNDDDQHDREGKDARLGIGLAQRFPRNEHEHGADKEHTAKAAKHISEPFPHGITRRPGHFVQPVLPHPPRDLRRVQAGLGRHVQTLQGVGRVQAVPVQLGELARCVAFRACLGRARERVGYVDRKSAGC
jgi:hypothetical protein